MIILNGNTQRFVGWIKGKVDAYLADTRSSRFKMTTDEGRVFFVYGRDEVEARVRLPKSLNVVRIEPAGFVENGELFVPEDEARAMADSTCGRDAPAKRVK
jgi:hypothetical protein